MQHAGLLQIRQGGGVAIFLQYDARLPGHLGEGGVVESLHGGYLAVQSPVKLVAYRVLRYDGLAEGMLAAALFQRVVERIVGGFVDLVHGGEFRVLAFRHLRHGHLVEAEGLFLMSDGRIVNFNLCHVFLFLWVNTRFLLNNEC